MGIGQSYATDKNDPYEGEKGLHVQGTRQRRNKLDFWMCNPPRRSPPRGWFCGICKQPMEKLGRCPRCYEGIEEKKEAL